MEMGYVENGFIVDLSNSRRTADMIYELSRILDIPEAKGKGVCLKFGDNAVEKTQLISIKALVESMEFELECITSNSDVTREAAEDLGIEVAELENEIPVPDFAEAAQEEPVNPELEKALDKIFGDSDFSDEQNFETKEVTEAKSSADDETMKK